MQPIRILSPDLTLQAEIDDYQSLVITRKWHKPGEIDLTINKYSKHADKLQSGNIIYFGARKAGIIRNMDIALDEGGKSSENWSITAVGLGAITKQRQCVPPDGQTTETKTGAVETVMRYFVDRHLVNPDDAGRKVDILELAPDEEKGKTIQRTARLNQVLGENLERWSRVDGLGWDIEVDMANGGLLFVVYEGKDLTTGQSENPPVIISPEYESAKSMSYSKNTINYRNYVYVQGDGTVEEAGQGTGLKRHETYLEEDDESDTGVLVSLGEEELSDRQIEKMFEAEIFDASPFRYEEDYDLGDKVTIQNKSWGVTMDARIIGVTETHEPSGFRLDHEFNREKPDLIDAIKRDIK